MVLIAGAAVGFVIGLAAEGATSWIAIRTARKRHPELWQHSGRPTLFGNGDLMKAWPLVRYYRDREYLRKMRDGATLLQPVSDARALRFAEKLRLPLVYSYYFAWLTAVLAILITAVSGFFGWG